MPRVPYRSLTVVLPVLWLVATTPAMADVISATGFFTVPPVPDPTLATGTIHRLVQVLPSDVVAGRLTIGAPSSCVCYATANIDTPFQNNVLAFANSTSPFSISVPVSVTINQTTNSSGQVFLLSQGPTLVATIPRPSSVPTYLDAVTYPSSALAIDKISLTINRAGAGPSPPTFKVDLKPLAGFLGDAFGNFSTGIGLIGGLTNPATLPLKLATAAASFATSRIAPEVGVLNSAGQLAVSGLSVADTVSSTINPISLTISVASFLSKLTSFALKGIAADPPDLNYLQLASGPITTFGLPASLAGAPHYVISNTVVTDFEKLLNDSLVTLASMERFEGAQLAGDTASKALQQAAFSTGAQSLLDDAAAAATDLAALTALLKSEFANVAAAGQSDYQSLLQYAQSTGLGNPFFAALLANGVSRPDAQAILTDLLQSSSPVLLSSAFDTLDSTIADLATFAGVTTLSPPPPPVTAVPEPRTAMLVLCWLAILAVASNLRVVQSHLRRLQCRLERVELASGAGVRARSG